MFACEFPGQELKSKQHTLNAEGKGLSFCSSGFALPLLVRSKTMFIKDEMGVRLWMVAKQREHDTGSTEVKEGSLGRSERITKELQYRKETKGNKTS